MVAVVDEGHCLTRVEGDRGCVVVTEVNIVDGVVDGGDREVVEMVMGSLVVLELIALDETALAV